MHVCDGQGGVVRCDQPARPCVHILKPIRSVASAGRISREPAGHGLMNGSELRSVSDLKDLPASDFWLSVEPEPKRPAKRWSLIKKLKNGVAAWPDLIYVLT